MLVRIAEILLTSIEELALFLRMTGKDKATNTLLSRSGFPPAQFSALILHPWPSEPFALKRPPKRLSDKEFLW